MCGGVGVKGGRPGRRSRGMLAEVRVKLVGVHSPRDGTQVLKHDTV